MISSKKIKLGQIEDFSADSDSNGGIQNVNRGAFTGEVNVSDENNGYYDDYISGGTVNLSLSATKVLGATATVRIKGDLTGTVPSDWNFSGQSFSSSAAKLNEITIMYVSSSDVRIVNRIVTNPNYVEYVDWEQETKTTDQGDGTLVLAASPNGGFGNGAYATKALFGNNALICKVPQTTGVGVVIGLDNNGGGFATTAIDAYILVNTDTMSYSFAEKGVTKFSGTWVHGTEITMRLNSGVVSLELDGSTVYTSVSSYTLPLTPVISMHGSYLNSAVNNAKFETVNNLDISPI
jgi:hypothetical protein